MPFVSRATCEVDEVQWQLRNADKSNIHNFYEPLREAHKFTAKKGIAKILA